VARAAEMPSLGGYYSKEIYYVDGLCAIQILLGRVGDPPLVGVLYAGGYYIKGRYYIKGGYYMPVYTVGLTSVLIRTIKCHFIVSSLVTR
jgi:hypothetical protein